MKPSRWNITNFFSRTGWNPLIVFTVLTLVVMAVLYWVLR